MQHQTFTKQKGFAKGTLCETSALPQPNLTTVWLLAAGAGSPKGDPRPQGQVLPACARRSRMNRTVWGTHPPSAGGVWVCVCECVCVCVSLCMCVSIKDLPSMGHGTCRETLNATWGRISTHALLVLRGLMHTGITRG